MTFDLEATFRRQDQLIARRQALGVLSENEIGSRLGRHWRVVLPGIYASSTAAPSRRQQLRAALLHAGADAMLNDVTALDLYRVPHLPDDPDVRVLVRDDVQRASREFVVLRRTTRLPAPVVVSGFPVAPIRRALCEFIARQPDERASLAVAAAVVQRGQASLEDLYDELRRGPARGRPRALRVLEPIQAGIRSAPEDDFRRLVQRSRVLPTPLWNPTLRLPGGQIVSPDALFEDAALVHETNGREYHFADGAGGDLFADMQKRHDGLVVAGLTVLHNAPRRLSEEDRDVLVEAERCYVRNAGRGLPPGVVILRRGP